MIDTKTGKSEGTFPVAPACSPMKGQWPLHQSPGRNSWQSTFSDVPTTESCLMVGVSPGVEPGLKKLHVVQPVGGTINPKFAYVMPIGIHHP